MDVVPTSSMDVVPTSFVDVKMKLAEDTGSLSIVIIGLFLITVASLMVMSDVASVFVAKRSLIQATEAAAQRGVHTLDESAYYVGKGNMFTVPLAAIKNSPHRTAYQITLLPVILFFSLSPHHCSNCGVRALH